MACAVREFMECSTVIFSSAFKLGTQGKCNAVSGRTIECSVSFLMDKLDAAVLDVRGYDVFGLFVRLCMLLEAVCVCLALMPSHWSMWNTL